MATTFLQGWARARAEHRATDTYLEELLADAGPFSLGRTEIPDSASVAPGADAVATAGAPFGRPLSAYLLSRHRD